MHEFCTAEKLKLPYLSAYLDSLGTNFRHGANFATGGSSICPGGYSPFHLGIQVSQFIQFKSRTTDLFNRLHSNSQFLILYSLQYYTPHDRTEPMYECSWGGRLGTMDLHNGMILSTLSISSHGFALGFLKRPRTNGDVFLTYKPIDHSLKPMEPSNNLPFIGLDSFSGVLEQSTSFVRHFTHFWLHLRG